MDIQITKNNLTNLMDTFNQKQLNQIIDVLQKEHSKMNIFIDDLRRSETFKNIPDPFIFPTPKIKLLLRENTFPQVL